MTIPDRAPEIPETPEPTAVPRLALRSSPASIPVASIPVADVTAMLHRLAAAPNWESYVQRVLAALIDCLGAPSGSFWLHDAAAGASELLATQGDGPDSSAAALPPGALTPPGLVALPVCADGEFLGRFLLAAPAGTCPPGTLAFAGALAQQVAPILRLNGQADRDREAAVHEERDRLACEIHDALAQHVAGILLQLGVARRIAGQQPDEAWSLVAQADQIARTAVAEARSSIWALQPVAAEYGDPARTLPALLAQMTAGTPVSGTMDIHGEPRRVPTDTGMNLLRIAQEALNNALRHARARHVTVELRFEPFGVRLRIEDDGHGFDPSRPRDGGFGMSGFGMIGMRQRAQRIGGELTIESRPGQGTAVTVTVATPSADSGPAAE